MGIVGELLQWEGGGVISIALWVSCSWGGGGGNLHIWALRVSCSNGKGGGGVNSMALWVSCWGGGEVISICGHCGSVAPVGRGGGGSL